MGSGLSGEATVSNEAVGNKSMASLRISRDSGYADRIRAYSILLDGEHLCRLRNGETTQLPIAPGQHDIRAKIDWCKTQPIRFAAAAGETVGFRVKSSCRGWRAVLGLWYVLFDWNSYVKI